MVLGTRELVGMRLLNGRTFGNVIEEIISLCEW